MREYCLVSRSGAVVNMCMMYKPGEPTLTDYMKNQGLKWVPVEKVPHSVLVKYHYWNERP